MYNSTISSWMRSHHARSERSSPPLQRCKIRIIHCPFISRDLSRSGLPSSGSAHSELRQDADREQAQTGSGTGSTPNSGSGSGSGSGPASGAGGGGTSSQLPYAPTPYPLCNCHRAKLRTPRDWRQSGREPGTHRRGGRLARRRLQVMLRCKGHRTAPQQRKQEQAAAAAGIPRHAVRPQTAAVRRRGGGSAHPRSGSSHCHLLWQAAICCESGTRAPGSARSAAVSDSESSSDSCRNIT